MKIRRKIFGMVVLVLSVALLFVYLFSQGVVLNHYKALEAKDIRENTDRALLAVKNQFAMMQVNLSNYSAWDDTLSFVQHFTGNVEEDPYLTSNYVNYFFVQNELQVMTMFDENRQLLYGRYYEGAEDRQVPVPEDLLAQIVDPDVGLLTHTHARSQKQGFLKTGSGVMMIVSQPITNSDRSGMIGGTIVFGRLLTPEKVAKIAEKTRTNLSVMPYVAEQFPALNTQNTRHIERTERDLIREQALLTDLYGDPLLVVEVDKHREIYNQGERTLSSIFWMLVVIAVLSASAFSMFIYQVILQRIVSLRRAVAEITATRTSGSRVPVQGTDEITDLQRAFNLLLESVEHSEETIKRQANLDPLTELPNRRLFAEQLQRALDEAKRKDGKVAVLFVDLDNFKEINDRHGHDCGDQLLRQLSERLTVFLGPYGTISRLGGDEFTVLLPNVSLGDVERAQQCLNRGLSQPFEVNGMRVPVSASVGISLYPNDGQDPHALIKAADTAMFRIKEAGRRGMETDEDMQRRQLLEQHLQHAVEQGELRLMYQPIQDLRTGSIIGAEALLRWHHPLFGNVSPSEFIPIAEKSGSILEIGNWVLRTACLQGKQWHAWQDTRFRMAVNLSAVQMEQEDLLEQIEAILADTGMNPEMLELEITESTMMRNVDEVIRKLEALKAMGISISIDDFGTGYSSLSYLQKLSVNNLKVDRSFVNDLAHSDGDMTIAKAVIDLGHNLNMHVIAEGVETEEQKTLLQALGCDQVQGYLIGKPMGAEEFTERLAGV
ncbi:EAL domain-containing protein [Tumebacillus sp. DT12]|uniref:EAL domain-containing protein n=1 Tax=Tumebacillus lacus TaxID=2995335 RepID=A0ABT3X2G2_9BACL|nr:EAL domain-containing protein [Tumebacillus lacus]MCX7570143.1 EAL domain-containing protein [Tumebacillus lacus]